MHRHTIQAALVTLLATGCATTTTPAPDPDAIWRRAERQHAGTVTAVAKRQQLQSDYAAVIRLSTDANQRGQAYVRLAELDMALGHYERARDNLTQSLHAGLGPANRPSALMLLGDVLERHLDEPDRARVVYQQVINEHPAAAEAPLAELRIKRISP